MTHEDLARIIDKAIKRSQMPQTKVLWLLRDEIKRDMDTASTPTQDKTSGPELVDAIG
jgi:hypothetical protein